MSTCEDCGRCETCPEVVCHASVHRPNTCRHGLHICLDCRPGNCDECAAETEREVA